MKRRWLPENVTEWTDRHGKKRYRFRKTGQPTYHFRHSPGSREFMEEYAAAKNAEPVKEPRFEPYTYDALISSFYRTKQWLKMKPSSQKTYRGVLERFRAKNGSKSAKTMTARLIDDKLVSMAGTPGAANVLRKILKRIHKHAVWLGWRSDNPVDATDPYPEGKGFHTWTEEEIALFEARWPLGTKERLAEALMLYLALRVSDAAVVGRQHRRGGKFHLHHGKNDSDTIVPATPELDAAIDACDSGHMTYLVTEFGKPYTTKGLAKWFKRACVKAGVPHCSPHGLRKAMSRRLAESGATTFQGRAVTGHKTDKQFAHYAEKANRELLADEAVANLSRRFAKRGSQDAE